MTVLGITLGGMSIMMSSPQTRTSVESQEDIHMREPAVSLPPSPREILARRGITWDNNGLRSAIDRNDIEVSTLFLRGGMNWQLSWTDLAMSSQMKRY